MSARFQDRAVRPAKSFKDLLRWRLNRLRLPPDTTIGYQAPIVPNDGSSLQSPEARITWIGHASFLLRLGGKLLAIDPLFSARISGVMPRLSPPGLALEVLPPLDAVLLTHNHRDHLDMPTLRRLGASPVYIVPKGNERLVQRAGAREVIALDWWENTTLGDLRITLVPAQHWSMRLPWDRNDMLWGGFVVQGSEGTIYHSGDTGPFEAFEEIGRRCGPIDWALLPIGAYEPRWIMHPQHMSPEEAAEAFWKLGAQTMVAMHWGAFSLSDEPMGEPPERLRAWWRQQGYDPARLWIPAIGESRTL